MYLYLMEKERVCVCAVYRTVILIRYCVNFVVGCIATFDVITNDDNDVMLRRCPFSSSSTVNGKCRPHILAACDNAYFLLPWGQFNKGFLRKYEKKKCKITSSKLGVKHPYTLIENLASYICEKFLIFYR